MFTLLIFFIITAHASKGSIVFSIVANLCEHYNSQTASLSLMKFCMNMYLDNL